MKNGLLICSGEGKKKNIGDYIQSIAAEQYFQSIDAFIEREKLNTFIADETFRLIMNGWFMHHPENWPPSDSIAPFFISFHIVPRVADQMLNPEGIAYLKKFAPIGCRDLGTMKLLHNKGISAYFSGCLTLTLCRESFFKKQKDNIIFVDPYYESALRKKNELYRIDRVFMDVFYLMKNLRKVRKLKSKFHYEFSSGYRYLSKSFDRMVQVSSFYRAYSKLFDDELLFNATYLGHSIDQSIFNNEEDKINYAKELIRKYSEAKFIITSRIHCALPCLAIETPVLFVSSTNLESNNPIRSSGRFEGILNLFHVLSYSRKKVSFERTDLNLTGKISKSTQIENKQEYLPLRHMLKNACQDFVSSTI